MDAHDNKGTMVQNQACTKFAENCPVSKRKQNITNHNPILICIYHPETDESVKFEPTMKILVTFL